MINTLLIFIGKVVSFISKILNLGNGSTWPGHIALSINKNFIKDLVIKSKLTIILIAGTNGKTTTGKLIKTILEKNEKKVLQNASGANLLNGIASNLLTHATIFGKIKKQFAIFEVDENSLPLILLEITPDYLVLLNIFRDQLDRYGETDAIAKKWESAVSKLPNSTTVVLNADDPQIAYIGKQSRAQVFYFGLNDKTIQKKTPQHAADTIYCPNCKQKLTFDSVYFSHLGVWHCKNCKLKRPDLDLSKITSRLPGVYNRYNLLAAALTTKKIGVKDKIIDQALKDFKPAFGRQEKLIVNGKSVQLFLSKNPTSMNESLRTVKELKAKHILFVLNDRIPDGRDVSWIWDVDFEEFLNDKDDISVAGDRAYDMSLRLKYAHPKVKHVDAYYPLLDRGIESVLAKIPKSETLFILPTYSAMLEVRKILTGRKIL